MVYTIKTLEFKKLEWRLTTCCAKMAGKEETPKCMKKTVTWTNEMIEDVIDFIEIHPIVAFEAVPSQPVFLLKARYTRYKFCIQVSFQENLNSSLCIHDARNFDEYTQVLAGDTKKCYVLMCIGQLRKLVMCKHLFETFEYVTFYKL
jgi:hypothetical protein